jgi:hypothetical protein
MAKEAKRTFRVKTSSTGFSGGRFKNTEPGAAASKAVKSILKDSSASSVNFILVESTRGGSKKEFSYTGRKIKLPQPIVRVVSGKTITYYYKYVAVSNKGA